MLAIKPGSPVCSNADADGIGPAVHQAMADLAGDLAFGLAVIHRATGGFQCMAHDLPQGEHAALIIRIQPPPHATQLTADMYAPVAPAVASDLAALAQIGEELLSAPMPRPFLEEEPESVNFLIKKALRVGVAAKDPALLGTEV